MANISIKTKEIIPGTIATPTIIVFPSKEQPLVQETDLSEKEEPIISVQQEVVAKSKKSSRKHKKQK